LDNDIQAKAAAEAVLKSSAAQVEQAKLNLEFTKVRSLVDGIAGIAQGQIGDLVGPTSVLTTVSQVEPIKAYFALSEQEYMQVAERISAVATSGKEPPKQPVLDLVLADGTAYPHKGWIVLADRQVDPKTGTIRIAGAFDNPGAILRPGQFGRVRSVSRIAKDALVVPQRAVAETQGVYMIAVVGSDNKASIRPVKTGEVVGQDWIITEGLKPGERVVVEGLQKIQQLRAQGRDIVNPKPYSPAATNPSAGGK
jgi:membrane fusion protein (multidrug efflux system)